MKNLRCILMIFFALVIASGSFLSAQTQNEQETVIEQIISKVSNKNFYIEVDRAIPMSGPFMNLSASNSLEIKGDTVVSYLPYFGRATTLPYGGGVGLNFEGKMTDFSFEKNKKGVFTVRFNTSSEDDYYRFNILLYSNKSATIYVQPNKKQSISFHGNLKLED